MRISDWSSDVCSSDLLVLAAHAADVRDLLRLDAGGDQPLALRPAGRRVGAGRRLLRRVLGNDLRPVLPGRVRQHDPDERDDVDPVPRRLAAAVRLRALYLDSGADLAVCQARPGPVLLPFGPYRKSTRLNSSH